LAPRKWACKSLIVLLLATIVAASAFAPYRITATEPRATNGSSVPSVYPTVVGWGGVRLDESQSTSANPPSQVFSGEPASNMELQVRRLQTRGFNAIRVSFQSACSSPQEMGAYNPAWLDRAITIARQYDFWIIVDYHGYNDLTSSSGIDCWLGYWSPIVQQFMSTYDQIIWEPINEPAMTSNTDIASLSNAYQQWINQARSFGDTHWTVVQNLCSSNCGFGDANMAAGYPTVSDTIGHVFISLHSYMSYQYYSSSWNNATADSLVRQFYNAVVSGSQRTGWPVLNTEGGADPQQVDCHGNVSLPSSQCAPDQVQGGSAGYSNTTFHFIQTLTSLYDSNSPRRINWLWWPTGSWTDTSLAEHQYGALSSDGWGSLLQYQKVPSLSLDGLGSKTNCQANPCAAQLLTTTEQNDVVILMVSTFDGTTITVTDSSGLDFTQRLAYSSTTRAGLIREYYAIAASPLNSDNITVVGNQCCYTIVGMQTLAVSGADTSIVYDQDPSVPAAVSCPSNTCGYCYADYNSNPGTCSAAVQTSSEDFVIAATQINDAPDCGGYPSSPAGYTPPPGFTKISQLNGRFEVDYMIANTPGSVVFDCNGTDATAIVFDAIVASD
jgi:Cellulase (glycosyl hydrolase family 5)